MVCFTLLTADTLFGAAQQANLSPEALRQMEHKDPQWLMVEPHLPDRLTSSPEKLEMAGDVLRARRLPEDAVEFYIDALRRGGREIPLLNKMGVTELELHHVARARAYFQRVVKLKKKNASGWNNLGATEYMDGQLGSAISDYNRAIKFDRSNAVFHSNLATVYLERADYTSARKQFEIALTLDAKLFEHRETSGVVMHLLSSNEHARFCFEMARLYAERDDEVNLLHYLTMSSEGGFDVLEAMNHDNALSRYRKDPRVLLLVRNARALRTGHATVSQATRGVPPLPPAEHE